MKILFTCRYLILVIGLISCHTRESRIIGETEILKWPEGKKTAVSLTYDDGSINQFRIALPMMDSLGFPATFYIITGQIPGSRFLPGFIGRPEGEILRESAGIPTHKDNLFERASLAAYAPWQGLREYHTRAGELYESGKTEEACRVIDEAFEKIRNGELKKVSKRDPYQSGENSITWDNIRSIAQHGHEFGSHTITHPRLAVLDEKNLLYELEKSREDILNFLGPGHTFSAECPYGTENERVMEYAYDIYPALRNRMPADYLAELNRGNRENPGSFENEYVQWQRGPLTDTPMELMKSWVDTCLAKDNLWLVLVFHGVEGIGWESKSSDELQEYFNYLDHHREKIWIATFRDVTRYIRERMNATVEQVRESKALKIKLTHNLDQGMYNFPLTLKTYIPAGWDQVQGFQDVKVLKIRKFSDEKGDFVVYNAIPNAGDIQLSGK
ncbi:MAG: polysaccharide deacetylase family protein [Cyclobacteriaceae bacterium]|nr:polysaccharide deacetylase family protein [Cyclobacteriaceae bacterium]